MEPEHVCAQLADLSEDAVAAARGAAEERPLAYALGTGEAEQVALHAGLKPVVRQSFRRDRVEDARRRFEERGLSVRLVDEEPAAGGPAPDRILVVAGPDPTRVEEVAALARDLEADHGRELGRLLGYPDCCVDAFVEAPGPRSAEVLARAALARTSSPPRARLNTLDLRVFHYLAWAPCRFDCPASVAYADGVAERIRHRYGQLLEHGEPTETSCPPGCRHEVFVEAIDDALGHHRLFVDDEVQLSLGGVFDGRRVTLSSVRATARDFHPDIRLRPAARDAVARLVALLSDATTVAVEGDALRVNGTTRLTGPGLLLAPFGEVAPSVAWPLQPRSAR